MDIDDMWDDEEDLAPHMKATNDEPGAEPERFFPFEFEVWQNDEMVASARSEEHTSELQSPL